MLRRAELYVSAAHNETYGRSLVEALRCGLPIVTVLLRVRVRVRGRGRGRGRARPRPLLATPPLQMGCSNLHVRHEENGLLGSDESQLAAQIRRVVRDGALRRRLKASVTRAQAPADPNAQMLATLLDVHQNGARLQASPPPTPSCPRRPRRAWACTPHPPRTSTARLALPKAAPVHTPPAGDVMAPRVEPLHAALGRR